jgi:hypothetical protein
LGKRTGICLRNLLWHHIDDFVVLSLALKGKGNLCGTRMRGIFALRSDERSVVSFTGHADAA